MNIMIAAVGFEPGLAIGGGSAQEALVIAGFALVGLVLLLAAGLLCGRGHARAHVAHYTSPRL